MKKLLLLLLLFPFPCYAGLKAVIQNPNTVVTSSSFISGHCVQFSSTGSGSATVSDSGGACGSSGGTPGGTTGQVQYNAGAGAFGGFTFSGDCTLDYTTGIITCTKTNGSAFASSATIDATNATNITSGTLPAARLPTPTSSTIGGVQSFTSSANIFLTGLNTSGVFLSAQPKCSNLSDGTQFCSATGTQATAGLNVFSSTLQGVVPASGGSTTQVLLASGSFGALPTPTTTVLGGVNSFASASNNFLTGLNTSGSFLSARPACSNLSDSAASCSTDATNASNISAGSLALARIAFISGNSLLGNITGSSAAPTSLTSVQTTTLCQAFSSTLIGCAPASGGGTANFLRADGSWIAPAGSGTVTSIAFGSGVTGGTVTSTGTVTLDVTHANTWTGTQTFSSIFISTGYAETNCPTANTSTSYALNIDLGPNQCITITGAVTLTLATPTHPGKATFKLGQDGSGHVYSITGCKWPGGTAITYSTAASAIDIVSVFYDGTNFYCMGGAAFS